MSGRERKSKGKEGTEEKGGEAGLLLESDGGGVPPTRQRGRAVLGRGAQLLRTRSGRGSRRRCGRAPMGSRGPRAGSGGPRLAEAPGREVALRDWSG